MIHRSNTLLRNILMVVFILALPSLLSSCRFTEPELLRIEDFRVTNFSSKSIELQVMAKVKNPNNYIVSIVNSNLNIFINGENMGKLNLKEKVSFSRNSTQSYTLMLENKPENFAKLGMASLMSMISNGKLQVNIKGTIKGRARMISKKFDVDLNEAIRMPRR